MSDPLPASADGRAASRDLRRLRVLAAVQEGLSYAAIGRAEGLSRERVRQIVVQALDNGQADSKLDHARVQPGSNRRCGSPRRRWAAATSGRSTGCCECSTGSTNTAPSRAARRPRIRAGAKDC